MAIGQVSVAVAVVALLMLSALASSSQVGCPPCGATLKGRKIATVHPGEPAGMLFGIASAGECAATCKQSSPDVMFYQFYKSKIGEPACLCLATCYSVYEADASEEAVSGSLCRDQVCPRSCSNAPAANIMYLGNPAEAMYQTFSWGSMTGNGTVNGSVPLNGTQLFLNGTLLANGTFSVNSTAGNSTLSASFGMSFEDCRAYAASNVFPPTPFFTHLEAMGACLLFDKCVGTAPAGTSTAKSGSFCLPSLLGVGEDSKARKDA